MNLRKYLLSSWPLLLVLIFLLPILFKVWVQSYGLTDGYPMGVRLAGFHDTLRTGQFPVRLLESTNSGYGYPVVNFLYPFPFYLAESFNLAGFSIVESLQLVFMADLILGAIGMYLFVRQKFTKLAGAAAAIIYTIFPYHFYGIFLRGSLGEATAFAFIPFVFYFSDRVIKSEKINFASIVLLAFSLALMAMSHNTLTFLFAPIIITYWLVSTLPKKLTSFYRLVLGGVLGTLLAATFWIPALLELSFTRAPNIRVAHYYENFLTGPNFLEYLGFPAVVILLGFLIIRVKDRIIVFFAVISVIAFLLSTQFSEGLWQTGLLDIVVQFPWRLTAILVLAGSVIGGVVFSKNKFTFAVVIVMAVIFLVTAKIGVAPPPSDGDYLVNGNSSTVSDEYVPIWVKGDLFTQPDHPLQIISGEGKVVDTMSGKVEMVTTGVVQINKVYYPGTVVKANGANVPIDFETNGLVRVNLQPGSYQLTRSFGETPLRQTANGLTVIGLIISLGLLYKWSRPHLKKRFLK